MGKSKFLTCALLLFIFASINPGFAGSATKWNLDKSHSQIRFSVNHFFTPVEGKFEKFDIDLQFDPDNMKESSIDVTIHVNSVNTGNEKRDTDLQSASFIETEKYPVATFKSKEILSKGDNNFVAKGTLKIKDIAKEIELPFTLLGLKEFSEDMQKKMRGTKKVAGFSASYTIDRTEFGVGTGNWAATLVVGGEVRITVTLETKI